MGGILVFVQKTEGPQHFPLFPDGEHKHVFNTYLLHELKWFGGWEFA